MISLRLGNLIITLRIRGRGIRESMGIRRIRADRGVGIMSSNNSSSMPSRSTDRVSISRRLRDLEEDMGTRFEDGR